MMTEQEIRELKQGKLNFIECKNIEISKGLDEVDQMRNEIKQVEQEVYLINRVLGDA